ncbi:hypothetical protein AJ85_16495 [Alkalihalobacillus alcalophilus ATCC 27647 = CGMCC 1.3604]|uniref:Pyrroline-5-carboxylate reductase catalytic N-terminal domain-containing protein n=1 Tax=Alkalihalobacillus alcalophilus ATCC 27647 = CGMCC 1.3604 TaxID=1218173 RepID=A0A094WPQ6_ALKAL|nr:hypothetical protein BALCAV_0202345 [Alkalihalobacillus alcalophilus ATCC 27647 = CGMCC 1.3604]THG92166.1 hypothetical protein AJ85_16495 [Alkalihalobacillus alcalophilus ATCC 27647 = CGMCC 1.3604]
MNVIVGSGRLAETLLSFWRENETVAIYSRNEQTALQLQQRYSFARYWSKEELRAATRLFLCLPKEGYADFFAEMKGVLQADVEIIHMATALMSAEVRKWCSFDKIIACKLAGHAKEAMAQKEMTLVLPKESAFFEKTLKQLFSSEVRIVIGTESDTKRANQLATKMTLQLIQSFEQQWQEQGLPQELFESSAKQIISGVNKAYFTGDLGGFAKKIKEQLEQEKSNDSIR